MFKRTIMLFVALFTFGGIFEMATNPCDVQASAHYIKWHDKSYKSKYTIKQMRNRYHLQYHKGKFCGFTVKDYYFYGVTTKGAYQHRSNDTHAGPSIHHKGTYAMFRSKVFDGGNAYSLDYVNLKTG